MAKRQTFYWQPSKDGDPVALAMFKRHYSYRPYKDGRQPKLFVGPGVKRVFLAYNPDGTAAALWVWRGFQSDDPLVGKVIALNNAVFRNEGLVNDDGELVPSSVLVAEASAIAAQEFPGMLQYTYIATKGLKSSNP